MNKWIAFFSQTGSEIVEVSKKLNKWPDLVVTNKPFEEITNQELLDHYKDNPDGIVCIPRKPKVCDYLNIAGHLGYSILNERWQDDVIVTLHGYLRILPADFCNGTKIFNGHPGLITKHPELKGFNPQKKAFEAGTYKTVGCVIHEVIPELDSGDVVLEGELVNQYDELETLIGVLHDLSIQLWSKFLKGKLC